MATNLKKEDIETLEMIMDAVLRLSEEGVERKAIDKALFPIAMKLVLKDKQIQTLEKLFKNNLYKCHCGSLMTAEKIEESYAIKLSCSACSNHVIHTWIHLDESSLN